MCSHIRVLIVEDTEDDALLLLRELRRGGYEPEYEVVETAEDMSAALDKRDWDIIISDYVMPQFSGLSAIRLLAEKKLDLPLIIVSGNIGEETAVAAMKAGAHDYILKGNYARLVPAIKRELEEAENRRKRRGAEEALRISEERFRRRYEAISAGVIVVDTDCIIRHPNRAACEILDFPQEKIIGTSILSSTWELRTEDNQIFPPEDNPGYITIHTGNPVKNVIMGIKVKDDVVNRWILVNSEPIFDQSSGKLSEILVSFVDITALKQAEEEIRERRLREQQIHLDAERAKREFYKGTVFSVTDGKLNLVTYEEIEDLLDEDAENIILACADDLVYLRKKIAELCKQVGLNDDQEYMLITALNEAAANAVKHANGGLARIGISNSKVQVCVQDHGNGMDAIILPKATLMRRFSTKPSMGLGYSLILASVDTVYLATEDEGTWILMEKSVNALCRISVWKLW